MSSYTLNPVDGEQVFLSNQKGELYHDVAFRATGSSPAGTIVLTAKKPGSQVFETIPDGTFDLSALNSIQFTGAVKEYKATISGLSGADTINMTDTAQRA
jgi:hypothetical protein